MRVYIIHIIVRQKQGQDIQEVWLRTEDKISLIYKKRENYKYSSLVSRNRYSLATESSLQKYGISP